MPENITNIKLSKQQLAAQIWKSCDDMRSDSGMDSSEYKTYIIGLLFYKWISEQEQRYLKEKLFFKDFSKLTHDNKKIKKDLLEKLGYFIPYDYLFSTWFNQKENINIKTVSDGLIDFDNNIYKDYEKQYKGILDDLKKGLEGAKLGSTTKEKNKAIYKLIKVINRIPTTSDDYDVLGYVYEYLISKFASSAGKKAGEFYTPHEPSEIMSRIVASHLKGRDKIKVYDPTSGSASLLMTIGNAFVKEGGDFDNVEYFAQEKNPITHNLTRINLIMKGISPSNFNTRNNNTLLSDWPYYETNGIKKPVICDAVVSNPPYSAKWTPFEDDRFSYGLAPKSRADYAFLLHDLYHLDDDGILAIVLPRGVLYRGKEDDESEGTIRKELINNDHIETIIGLPANIFFGTPIPTIIMILKRKRDSSDVLFIDASRGFVKDRNKNRIRECDIKKIADTAINRVEIPNYSKIVKKEEIKKNDYNLNIPRYVSSNDKDETWDIGAIMRGDIPNTEIESLSNYWDVFKNLKHELFEPVNNSFSRFKNDFDGILSKSNDVNIFKEKYIHGFDGFDKFLYKELISNIEALNVNSIESNIVNKIFDISNGIDMVDGYSLYQVFVNRWKDISSDLDIISKYGSKSITEVSSIYEYDEDGDSIQIGIDGTIIPLELVKKELLKDEYNVIFNKENRVDEIRGELEAIISGGDLEEINDITNDDNTKFIPKEVLKKVSEIFEDINDGEIGALKEYLSMLDDKKSKSEQIDFIKNNNLIRWEEMEPKKDGTYGKKVINKYLNKLYENYKFDENSTELTVLKVYKLLKEVKELNNSIKILNKKLTDKAIETLINLSLKDAYKLLEVKWIKPLNNDVLNYVNFIIDTFKDKITYLRNKYEFPLNDIEKEIVTNTTELVSLMNELSGNNNDINGINDFISLFGDSDDK